MEEEGSLASFTDYIGHHVASLTGEGEEEAEEERQTDRRRRERETDRQTDRRTDKLTETERQREVLQKHEDLSHDCP